MIFLRGKIIGRLECGLPSRKYPRNSESPRVSSPGFGNDSKMLVIRRRRIDEADISTPVAVERDVNCLEEAVRSFTAMRSSCRSSR
ncbi:hypothetical protein TNCV_1365471 [Trichonephila clavipes]|nr:hypothetical protein TNCV_1365471 [Trichonephila clavipes]